MLQSLDVAAGTVHQNPKRTLLVHSFALGMSASRAKVPTSNAGNKPHVLGSPNGCRPDTRGFASLRLDPPADAGEQPGQVFAAHAPHVGGQVHISEVARLAARSRAADSAEVHCSD
jgi:hypothetical protein